MCNKCYGFCRILTAGIESDIDGHALVFAMTHVPGLPSNKMNALELLALGHQEQLEELYPNLWVAL